MADDWKPDFQDASLLDDDKASFIFDAADMRVSATIQVADDLRKSAAKVLAFLTGALSAVSGFMLLKCDLVHAQCSESHGIFVPGVILLIGYFLTAFLVIVGCMMPRHFRFRGNEPRNLLCSDVCQDGIKLIKVRMAVGMQKDITQNAATNSDIAWYLTLAYSMSVLVPMVSFLAALWQ